MWAGPRTRLRAAPNNCQDMLRDRDISERAIDRSRSVGSSSWHKLCAYVSHLNASVAFEFNRGASSSSSSSRSAEVARPPARATSWLRVGNGTWARIEERRKCPSLPVSHHVRRYLSSALIEIDSRVRRGYWAMHGRLRGRESSRQCEAGNLVVGQGGGADV